MLNRGLSAMRSADRWSLNSELTQPEPDRTIYVIGRLKDLKIIQPATEEVGAVAYRATSHRRIEGSSRVPPTP
jgi:hypothetical protein